MSLNVASKHSKDKTPSTQHSKIKEFSQVGESQAGLLRGISSDPSYPRSLYNPTKSETRWRPFGSVRCSDKEASFSSHLLKRREPVVMQVLAEKVN